MGRCRYIVLSILLLLAGCSSGKDGAEEEKTHIRVAKGFHPVAWSELAVDETGLHLSARVMDAKSRHRRCKLVADETPAKVLVGLVCSDRTACESDVLGCADWTADLRKPLGSRKVYSLAGNQPKEVLKEDRSGSVYVRVLDKNGFMPDAPIDGLPKAKPSPDNAPVGWSFATVSRNGRTISLYESSGADTKGPCSATAIENGKNVLIELRCPTHGTTSACPGNCFSVPIATVALQNPLAERLVYDLAGLRPILISRPSKGSTAKVVRTTPYRPVDGTGSNRAG